MTGNFDVKEFADAWKKLPPPISCFANGAACPWCGAIHSTVTFGSNNCNECRRAFSFGYPEGHEGDDPCSWVPFPHREFNELGGKAALMSDWEPNDRLKHHYHQKAEERAGVKATEGNPQ